jgi:YHS domain-containing protein
MQSCDSKNTSGGALIAAACCCTDCKCENCTCAENCCSTGGCAGCKDNACCDKGNCKDASCCKDNKSGGISNENPVCVVSGEEIAKGKEIVFNYLGKDYTFCCNDCVASFKNEPIKFVKEGLNCPVMGEAVNKNVCTVYEGTKYYFCCIMCIKDFKEHPHQYLKKHDSTPKNEII